jgi:hypothetical protein
MSSFRVYYGDGMVYDSATGGKPAARNVQVIVQEHPDVGWHTQSKKDYYIWRDGRYVGVDLFGVFDWLLDRGDILFGRTLTQKQFDAIMKKAIADLGEAKTGWMRDEVMPDG